MSVGLLLALLLALASPAWGAIAHVQTVSCSASGASSCTTPSITSTTGNLFIVASAHYTDGVNSVISDSKSNSYTAATSNLTTFNIVDARIDYKASGTGGASHTFTWTSSDSLYASISASEISGAAASPFDKTAGTTDSGTTSHSSGSTATTTQANELLLGAGFDWDNSTPTPMTATGGYTERTNIVDTAPNNCCILALLVGTKVVAATGAYDFSFTTPSTARTAAHVTTWKEFVAAGGVRQRCVGCGADGKVIE